MTMYEHQYFNMEDDDKDSICNELVYPPVDGGFYSDAEYQSPGLNLDQSRAVKGLFNPIAVPESANKQEVSKVRRSVSHKHCANTGVDRHPQRVLTNKAFEKTVKNIDSHSNKQHFTPSANKATRQQQLSQDSRSQRHSRMKPYFENSGFFYIPSTNSLTPPKNPSPNIEGFTKEENISPVTISSGYSSDKEEALRQLDLDYASDDNPSPMQKVQPQLSPIRSRHCVTNKDGYAIKPDELYDESMYCDASGCYEEGLFHTISGNSNTLGQHVASNLETRGVPQRAQSCKKSKDIHYNRRNSIAVNPSHANSLKEVKQSLSNLAIKSSDCPKASLSTAQVTSNRCKTMKRPVSTTSNVSVKDIEKLPEMLPAGVRTSFTTSSGILMAPEASAHCGRCFSFTTSPVIKSPSPDLSHFRVSEDSAFRPVKTSSARSNSTPPRHHFVTSSLELFRQGGDDEHQYMSMSGDGISRQNCPQLFASPSGSRVTSLSSDSGRGSASSFDLALNDLPPLSHEASVFSNGSSISHEAFPIYQDITKEQVYETVPEPRGERYCDVTIHSTPPKLPKRNARSVHSTPRSTRKTSTLVKYEDIVKPQDIVDPSAMHMYTVADVLKSVDRLSSDIPKQSNEMCIHDDYAHFVFGDSTRRSSLQRSSSHSKLRDGQLELRITSPESKRHNDSFDRRCVSSPRVAPSNLTLPLRPRQNTACEAQTKRLPKIKDALNANCNSPCLKNKLKAIQSRDQKHCTEPVKGRQSLKSLPSRTASCVGDRTRSHSLSRSQVRTATDSTIAWSPRDNLKEVYC